MKEGIHPKYGKSVVRCASRRDVWNRRDERSDQRWRLFQVPSFLHRTSETRRYGRTRWEV